MFEKYQRTPLILPRAQYVQHHQIIVRASFEVYQIDDLEIDVLRTHPKKVPPRIQIPRLLL